MTDYARFRPLFAEALDPRLYPIEHLDSLVLSMRAQLWFGEASAIVTEIRPYPSGALVIEGLVAAVDPGAEGGLAEIVDILIPRAEAWGRSLGCSMARIESRSGWVRKLKDKGWQIQQTALVKELCAF